MNAWPFEWVTFSLLRRAIWSAVPWAQKWFHWLMTSRAPHSHKATDPKKSLFIYLQKRRTILNILQFCVCSENPNGRNIHVQYASGIKLSIKMFLFSSMWIAEAIIFSSRILLSRSEKDCRCRMDRMGQFYYKAQYKIQKCKFSTDKNRTNRRAI